MAKNLRDIISKNAGRNVPKGEEDFLATHTVNDRGDVNKNKNVFTADNVKPEAKVQKNDPGKRHGYRSVEAAAAAYEETEVAEAKKKTTGSKVGSEDDRNVNATDYGYASTGSTVSEKKCNMTAENVMCEVHGLKECWKEDTFYHGKELGEREMSDAEMKKREDIVKGMKKNVAGFKQRYGERAKEVMYATATKKAMGK
jgi:hypothetical protein